MAKKFDSPKGPSQRQLRVGELVRHAISDVLSRNDVSDDALKGQIITVPEVRMSPDLKLATIYVMPLGGKHEAAVVEALERHKRFLKGELSRQMREFKFMPDIRFRVDDRFDEAMHIDKLLHDPKVRQDLATKPDTPDE
jgi:ribosome-binding factor A